MGLKLFGNKLNRSLIKNVAWIPDIQTSDHLDPISTIIAKYALHPSILTIKKLNCTVRQFELKAISEDTMFKKIMSLKPGKKVSGSIPIKALQFAANECAGVLTKIFN